MGKIKARHGDGRTLIQLLGVFHDVRKRKEKNKNNLEEEKHFNGLLLVNYIGWSVKNQAFSVANMSSIRAINAALVSSSAHFLGVPRLVSFYGVSVALVGVGEGRKTEKAIFLCLLGVCVPTWLQAL